MNTDTEQPQWSLKVQHLRGLRDIEWAPEGVSLLVGPNGSGKTTLISTIQLAKNIINHGVPKGISLSGGVLGQKNIFSKDKNITISICRQKTTWSLDLDIQGPHAQITNETATSPDDIPFFSSLQEVIDSQHYAKTRKTGQRAIIKLIAEEGDPCALKITDFIDSYRSFQSPAPENIDISLPEDWGTRELRADGRNLLHVLATWRGAPRTYGDRFAWVERKLKEAFPELIDGLDLELLPSATVHATFYPPQAASTDAKLPLRFAADGLKVMLHHLTAVAGAEQGAVIAIDEVENHLHPFAIRKLIEAMREIAEERELTILLTTHSPVLLDAFRECPEQVWVLEENGVGPRRLDQLFEPDWLAHFSLGQLYDRLKFGAPHPAPPPEDADARSVDPDR